MLLCRAVKKRLQSQIILTSLSVVNSVYQTLGIFVQNVQYIKQAVFDL
jgi:hypothetical protein